MAGKLGLAERVFEFPGANDCKRNNFISGLLLTVFTI